MIGPKEILGDAWTEDPDILETYRRDRAALTSAGSPIGLARVESPEQVSRLLDWANTERVPVVPRGAGSGLSGGASALDGSVILSLERMNRVLEVNAEAGWVVADAGVITQDIKEAALEVGMMYPPDPASASFCTIGGNIATNAGGLCCIKYGVTRDYVMSLQVVLADGEPISIGHLTRKDVAGYDLASLLIGSEGTLGVVTQATLRLVSRPQPPSTLVATFEQPSDAVAAARKALRDGVDLSLLEYMDRTTLEAIDAWKNMGLTRQGQALLVAQSDTRTAPEEIDKLSDACKRSGAVFTAQTSDPSEAESLMDARRLAYPALERLGTPLLDDVAVPRNALTEFLNGIDAISGKTSLRLGVFGHLGDGNLHPTVVFDHDDQDAVDAAKRIFEAIVELALRLDGTVTGEHGVGTLKLPHLRRGLGERNARLQEGIKGLFDPNGILNPGKAVPTVNDQIEVPT